MITKEEVEKRINAPLTSNQKEQLRKFLKIIEKKILVKAEFGELYPYIIPIRGIGNDEKLRSEILNKLKESGWTVYWSVDSEAFHLK